MNYFSATIAIVNKGYNLAIAEVSGNMFIKALHRDILWVLSLVIFFTNDMLFILDDDVDIYNYADDSTHLYVLVMIMIM